MIGTERLKELVGKFPTPAAKDGKLAEVDKQAADEAVAELVAGGREAVVGLVELLVPASKGGDSQVRHALHALVIHVGGVKGEKRKTVAEALASTLNGDRPADVKGFVLRQLQLIGGEEVVASVGKLLTDDALGDEAATTLLAVRTGAAEQFRAALPQVRGRRVVVVVQALGTLRDRESAAELRKLLTSEDREARMTAAWAVANLGDAESAALLLKASDGAEGFERTKTTQACLLLAETLLAAGQKKEAAAIYRHLESTRTDAAERHVRDAATRGLAVTR